MKYPTIITIYIAGILSSCSSEPKEKITGTYVRENTYEAKHFNTGRIIGHYTVRDTIFISAKQTGYQIDNKKWKNNDYDTEGWRNQAHAENRPLYTYIVSYDKTDQTLNPDNALIGKIIYLDFEKKIISLNKKMENTWKKVE